MGRLLFSGNEAGISLVVGAISENLVVAGHEFGNLDLWWNSNSTVILNLQSCSYNAHSSYFYLVHFTDGRLWPTEVLHDQVYCIDEVHVTMCVVIGVGRMERSLCCSMV